MKNEILYEDNHIIAVNKHYSDIVQGDITGDIPLSDIVKRYLKDKYNKPGKVYLGVPHRLDRPVSGAILFARTSKALTRLNKMFKDNEIQKNYWAIVGNKPLHPEATLKHYLTRNNRLNKSFVHDIQVPASKYAELSYKLMASGERYHLLSIKLKTGRHHQIRAQLAHSNMPVKGDLKYGAKRSNQYPGICLHAQSIEFIHPVSEKEIKIVAPTPHVEKLWRLLSIND